MLDEFCLFPAACPRDTVRESLPQFSESRHLILMSALPLGRAGGRTSGYRDKWVSGCAPVFVSRERWWRQSKRWCILAKPSFLVQVMGEQSSEGVRQTFANPPSSQEQALQDLGFQPSTVNVRNGISEPTATRRVPRC